MGARAIRELARRAKPLGRLHRRPCEHIWFPTIVRGWVIEECPKCLGRRMAS